MTRLKRLCLFEWISAFAAASKRDAQKRARALSPAPLGAVSAGSKEGAAALLQGLLLTQSSSQTHRSSCKATVAAQRPQACFVGESPGQPPWEGSLSRH